MFAKAQVNADYTTTIDGCSPWTVTFADISTSSGTDIVSWSWDFADGTTSSMQNPSHTYITGGNYNVCLTASNTSGEMDTACKNMFFDEVIANAETPPLILDCIVPDFTLDGVGSSEGPNYIYQWSTVNGNILSGSNTLNPLVNAAGDYEILVTDITTGCTATASTMVEMDVNVPIVAIASPAMLTCINSEITLDGSGSSAGPDLSYSWTDMFGNFISSNNTINVSQPGVYTLEITDITIGCNSYSQVEVLQDITIPISDAGADQTLDCTTTSVILNGTGSSVGNEFTYAWFNMNSATVSTNLNAAVTSAGSYTLVVTNVNNGCSASDAVEVLEDPINLPTVVETNFATCSGEMVTLDFSSPCPNCTFTVVNAMGNSECNSSFPCQVDPANGPFTITIEDTSTGCQTTQNLILNSPQPLVADLNVTNISCAGENDGAIDIVGAGGTPPYHYSWSNGIVGANIFNLSVGTYEVTITDFNGCTETISATIEESDAIDLILFPENPYCSDIASGLIELSASGGAPPYTYEWSNGSINPALENIPVGTYGVTVTDANACTVSGEATLVPSANI